MALMRTLVAAGLKRGKGSFADIFLLMALTAAALTFTVSMYADLNAREEVALAEIGAGDVYAVDMATNLTDEVAAEVDAVTADDVRRVLSSFRLSVCYTLTKEAGADA